jgi:hypothetical protein
LPPCPLHTSKIFLQWSEEVADDWHAPRPDQQSLPRQAAHVGDVCIVDREAKNPEGEGKGKKGRVSVGWAETRLPGSHLATHECRQQQLSKKHLGRATCTTFSPSHSGYTPVLSVVSPLSFITNSTLDVSRKTCQTLCWSLDLTVGTAIPAFKSPLSRNKDSAS